MGRTTFRITHEEALVLDLIAHKTKMDSWFRIDGNLHVHDLGRPNHAVGDAAGVIRLDNGLLYLPIDVRHSEAQKKTYQNCVDRAYRSRDLLPKYDQTGIAKTYMVVDETEKSVSYFDPEKYLEAWRKFNRGWREGHEIAFKSVRTETSTGKREEEILYSNPAPLPEKEGDKQCLSSKTRN